MMKIVLALTVIAAFAASAAYADECKTHKSRAVFVPYSAYEKYKKDGGTNPAICRKRNDWCEGCCEGGGDCVPEESIDPVTGLPIWWCECGTASQRKKLYEEGLSEARKLLSPEDFEKYTQRMAEEFSD